MKIKKFLSIIVLFALLSTLSGELGGFGGFSGVEPRVSADENQEPEPEPELPEVFFSHESGFYSNSFNLTLSATEGASVYYALGGLPTSRCEKNQHFTRANTISDTPYTSPINVNAGSKVDVFTIRAYAVKDGKYSPVAVRNYVKGTNVKQRFSEDTLIFSLNSDPHGLTNYYDGIFEFGYDRDQWRDDFRKQNGRNPIKDNNMEETPAVPANFNRKGEESARRAYVEMFDSRGNVYVSQDVEMRVKGGFSRSYPRKSIELYARDGEGKWDPFLFPFFDENSEDGNIMLRYRRLRLRNGGSDRQGGFIRDEVGATLIRQAGFPMSQKHTPAAIFINGEYYSVSWLKTPRTENHFMRLFGGNQSQYRYIEGGENYCEEDTLPEVWSDWQTNILDYAKNGLTDNNRWNTFQSRINIDDFMLYYAFQIYIQNQDWPNHNMEMWRYVPTEEEKNDPNLHPRLKSGKWSWIPHDLESSFNVWGDAAPSINTIHNILYGGNQVQWQGTSAILNAVLARSDMKGRFANTLVDLMEGVMKPSNVKDVVDSLYARLEKEHTESLNSHVIWPFNEWGEPKSGWPHAGSMKDSRDRIVSFANERPNHMYNFINQTLNYDRNNRYAVTVTASENGEAVMNSRPVGEGKTETGNYYNNTSITVTAKPYPGYAVSRWEVDGITQQSGESVTVNKSANVKVFFEKRTEGLELQISAVKSTSFSSDDDDGNNWIELYNPTNRVIATRGLFLSDNNSDFYKYKFPSMYIQPGKTLRFITKRNKADISPRKRMNLDFNINLGETLRLTDASGNVIVSAVASIMDENQVQTLGKDGKYKVGKESDKPPVCPTCGGPLPCDNCVTALSVPVRLMARGGDDMVLYQSATVNINGNGRYSVTVNISGNNKKMANLGLMAEGATFDSLSGAKPVPDSVKTAAVIFENITVNGISVRNDFNRPLLSQESGQSYVRTSIWNAWSSSRYLNTSDISQISSGTGVYFGLPSNATINTISLEFVISGIS